MNREIKKEYKKYKKERKKAGCRKPLSFAEWLECKNARGLLIK